MRADRFLSVVAIAVTLLAVPSTARAAADVAAADEAFDAGDNANALALYDEVLAANPGDIHALLRSGMLLSWDKKYDDALARYDQALTREPHNAQVLLERGKVLLWSRRYDEAIAAFEKVLQEDPHQAWALCGTAQAYAWRGQNAKARPYYERALVTDPGLKEARMGLAYVDLDEGDTSAALELSTALKAQYPDDAEVAELDRAVRKARAPWIQIGYDHMDDSDENRMNTYLAEGGFSMAARTDLRLGYAHSDLHGPVPGNGDADGTADILYGALGWQPKPRHRGELRVGAARLTDSTGSKRTTAVGGLAYTFPMATWSGRAAVAYDPFLYSPQILDNEIDITSVTFAAWGMSSARVRIETDGGYGDFSDGNTRLNANAGAWYVWKWPRRSLLLGGAIRYLTFSEDLDDGYFDPSNLIAGVASLRSSGAIGSSKWEYESAVEVGTQSYTFQGAKTSGKPLWNLYGLVARPLPHGLSFQIYAGYGNSSTASGPGYDSITYGARLRWAIGG